MRLDYSWLGPFVFAFLSSRMLRPPVPTPRFFRPAQLVLLLPAASPPLLFILRSPVPCSVFRVPRPVLLRVRVRLHRRRAVLVSNLIREPTRSAERSRPRASTASERVHLCSWLCRGLASGPPRALPSACHLHLGARVWYHTRAYQYDVLPRAKAGLRRDGRPVDPGRPFIQGGRLRAYDCVHTYIHTCLLAPSHSRTGTRRPPASPSDSVRIHPRSEPVDPSVQACASAVASIPARVPRTHARTEAPAHPTSSRSDLRLHAQCS